MVIRSSPHKDQCRIVLLGDEKVGKTALVNQLIDGVFIDHHTPTLLDSTIYQESVDGQTYNVEVIDTSSDSTFELHRSPYIETADVIVLVYSVIIKDSLLSLKKYVDEVVKVRRSGLDNFLAKSGYNSEAQHDAVDRSTVATSRYHKEVPIVLVGTHLDLVSSCLKGTDLVPLCAPARVEYDLVESVSEHCLKSVGFPVGSLSNGDESNIRKKKNNSFQRLIKNLFKIRKGADKLKGTNGGSKASSPLFPNHGSSNELVNPPLSPTLSFDGSNVTTFAPLPPGVSDRLPIFELSVKNSDQVTHLFLLILRLHVLVKNAQWAGLGTPLLSPMFVRTYSSSSLSKKFDSPLNTPMLFHHGAVDSNKFSFGDEKSSLSVPFLTEVPSAQKESNYEIPLNTVVSADAETTALPVPLQQAHTPDGTSSPRESVDSQSLTARPQSLLRPSSYECIASGDGPTSKSTPDDTVVISRLALFVPQGSEEDLPQAGRGGPEPCPVHTRHPSQHSLGASNPSSTSGVPGTATLTTMAGTAAGNGDGDKRVDKHSLCVSFIDAKDLSNHGDSNVTGFAEVLQVTNAARGTTRWRGGGDGGRLRFSKRRADRSHSDLLPRPPTRVYHAAKPAPTQQGSAATRSRYGLSPHNFDGNLRRTVSSNDTALVGTPPVSPFSNLLQREGGVRMCARLKRAVELHEQSFSPSDASYVEVERQFAVGTGHEGNPLNTMSANAVKERTLSSEEFTPSLQFATTGNEGSKQVNSPQACVKGRDVTETEPRKVVRTDEGGNLFYSNPDSLNPSKDENTSITMSAYENLLGTETLVNRVTASTKELRLGEEKSLNNNFTQDDIVDVVYQGYHSASTPVIRPSTIRAKKVNAEPCSRNSCFTM